MSRALAWTAHPDWVIEEKLDGVWHVGEPAPGCIGAGERLRSGRIVWFDLAMFEGQDVSRLPLRQRHELLEELRRRNGIEHPARGVDGRFVAEVLARGGEGVVFKRLDAPWGAPWWKAKRQISVDARVIEVQRDGSVALLEADGVEAGHVALGSWAGSVRPGDWVEVIAYGWTARHRLREPRMMRSRPDLAARHGLIADHTVRNEF